MLWKEGAWSYMNGDQQEKGGGEEGVTATVDKLVAAVTSWTAKMYTKWLMPGMSIPVKLAEVPGVANGIFFGVEKNIC